MSDQCSTLPKQVCSKFTDLGAMEDFVGLTANSEPCTLSACCSRRLPGCADSSPNVLIKNEKGILAATVSEEREADYRRDV